MAIPERRMTDPGDAAFAVAPIMLATGLTENLKKSLPPDVWKKGIEAKCYKCGRDILCEPLTHKTATLEAKRANRPLVTSCTACAEEAVAAEFAHGRAVETVSVPTAPEDKTKIDKHRAEMN